MAGMKLPPELEALEFNQGDVNVHDIQQNPAAPENGLSLFQRFVAQNLFDTQPKRRRSYLKRLGFDMSKDGKGIRPLTNPEGEFEPLDPNNAAAGFLPSYDLLKFEGYEELGKDALDVVFDTVVAGPLTAFAGAVGGTTGFAAGGAGGTALAGPPGGVAGALGGGGLGLSLGGAAGNAAAENLKAGLGDVFLDEEVPLDMQPLLYQSLTAGLFNLAGKLGGDAFKAGVKRFQKSGATGAQDSLKELATIKSNRTFNEDIANAFVEHPELFTKKAMKGAAQRLNEIPKTIFGVDGPVFRKPRQLEGGLARHRIKPINDQADLELDKLAKDPTINTEVEDLIETVEQVLSGKGGVLSKRPSRRKKGEIAALNFINEQVALLKKDQAIIDPKTGKFLGFDELNFREVDDFLDVLEDVTHTKDFTSVLSKNPTMLKASAAIRQKNIDKATETGSNLADLRAQQEEILNLHDQMLVAITPHKMANFAIGKTERSAAKQETRALVDEMERVLGAELATPLKTAQFQTSVDDMFRNPAAFGSGSIRRDLTNSILKEVPKSAFRGGALGGIIGDPILGAKIGAVVGGVQAAKRTFEASSPERLLKSVSRIKTRLADIEAKPGQLGAPGQAVVGGLAQRGKESVEATQRLKEGVGVAPRTPEISQEPFEQPPELEGPPEPDAFDIELPLELQNLDFITPEP